MSCVVLFVSQYKSGSASEMGPKTVLTSSSVVSFFMSHVTSNLIPLPSTEK